MSSHTSSALASPEQEETHLFETIHYHRVVALPELLSIIFSNLQRIELARAARVCRIWSPVALDYLWEHIDDLPQLFRVYGPQKKPHRLARLFSLKFAFENISKRGRLDAFWAHARRIRTVSGCSGDYTSNVIPHLLHEIEKAGYGKTFLPNLRKINLTGYNDSGDSPQFLPIFSLIPATLECLSFGMVTPLGTTTALAMLQTFSAAPMEHLTSICLGWHLPTSQDLRQAFTTFLRHQKRLEYMGLFSLALSTEDIRNIGFLPRLTELELCHIGDTGQALEEVCAAIGEQFQNLRKLSIINKARARTNISVMEGLAPCHDLRAVTIMCSKPNPVTAEAIHRLGPGWPKLEELCFQPYEYDESADYDGAPIEVLEDVASCWSETITTISLIFDANNVVRDVVRELPERRFKKLRTIMMNHCFLPDDRVRPVAEFIAAICTKPPYLELPSIGAETGGDWYAVMEEVGAIIKRRQT